jgi:hypothetical protein
MLPLSMDMGKTLMKFMHSIDFGCANGRKAGNIHVGRQTL